MAAAAMRVAPRHWVYLDDARSHEVHAEVEAAPAEDRLVTTEFPAGSRDPNEAIQSVTRVAAEAEVQRILTDLESRLRLTGNYYRADVADMRWQPLGRPAGADGQLDLRGIELPVPGAGDGSARMGFHHFHASTSTGGQDLLLISMPRLDMDPSKHALAELSFRFPRVDAGDLRVLHTRLTTSTLKSTLVKRHMELPRDGFAKLLEPKDYQAAYGDEWLEQTRGMFGQAASRMVNAGASGSASLLTRGGPGAPADLDDVVRALGTRRIAELKARVLADGEEQMCIAGGEHVIRRIVQAKRRSMPHTDAYLISVLEATLLCDYAVRQQVWSLVEEEGNKLLRFVHGYQ